MDKNSVVVLPEGSKIPEGINPETKIIGFLQEDGSIKVRPKSGDPKTFDNMSEFFRSISNV